MNSTAPQYSEFGLVRDMLASVNVLRDFDPAVITPIVETVRSTGRLLLTGEGSSRIFPAKNAINHAHKSGDSLNLHTEAATQAAEYQLDNTVVVGVSNSGRTAEVIRLFNTLRSVGHRNLFSVTAHAGSTLETISDHGFTLKCGAEAAVAATKSVLEQALHIRALVDAVAGRPLSKADLAATSRMVEAALTTEIDPEIVRKVAAAGTIYFAGRNDGVSEELTLKTNEITHKHSDFLEGTYAAHGIEEVMKAGDVLIWIEPFENSEAKFADVLVKGAGVEVIAISTRETSFPTIRIQDAGSLAGYVQMAAGWNLLVETGLALGVNLDKPQRARKVGNEFTG